MEVRERDTVIGDHLSCNLLLLSLGWTYSDSTFQGYSKPETRRHGNQMKLTRLERRALLQSKAGGRAEEELKHSLKSAL